MLNVSPDLTVYTFDEPVDPELPLELELEPELALDPEELVPDLFTLSLFPG
ncbi:hypothetical protein [Virgibacillus alimentarius]|uniref:hypothetical protein n=1 Tax=Virgibacillus alimentarius TaxID=698769 RepID=UPI000AFC7298|nr:hypothetical protein [Virgibacillus alimentarius]